MLQAPESGNHEYGYEERKRYRRGIHRRDPTTNKDDDHYNEDARYPPPGLFRRTVLHRRILRALDNFEALDDNGARAQDSRTMAGGSSAGEERRRFQALSRLCAGRG